MWPHLWPHYHEHAWNHQNTNQIGHSSLTPLLSAKAQPPDHCDRSLCFYSCSSTVYSPPSSLSKLLKCKSDHATDSMLKSSRGFPSHLAKSPEFSLVHSTPPVLALLFLLCTAGELGVPFRSHFLSSFRTLLREYSPPSTLIWSSDFLSLAHFSFLHKTEMHQILCYVHICLFIHYSHQPLGCKLHVLFTTVFPILKTLSAQ